MKEMISARLRRVATLDRQAVLDELKTDACGLTPEQAEKRRENKPRKKNGNFVSIVSHSFFTPFTILLLIVDLLAFIIGLIEFDSDNLISAGIIFVILVLSGIIQCVQNIKVYRSYQKAGRLTESVVTVRRNGILLDIMPENLAVGDIVFLTAGSRVFADLRLIESDNLCVSQAAVTGESMVIKKTATPYIASEKLPLPKYINLIFSGSAVVSGKGEAVVLSLGKNTLFGQTPISRKKDNDKGAGSIVKSILSFLAFLVPVSLLIVGLTTKNFNSAFLFALSVVVGMIPEMLPLVVSVCLAKGSKTMMKKKTLIRSAATMRGFAGMDVLCVDKTGTLTDSQINLEYFLDPLGNESEYCLSLAYLNAIYASGVKNYIDQAILKYGNNPSYGQKLSSQVSDYRRVADNPFGYTRKYASVLLKSADKTKLVVKGSSDEVVARCSSILVDGKAIPITDDKKRSVDEVVGELLADGMKVLAVAEKLCEGDETDETELTLVGYLVFFDAPKPTAKQAIKRLKDNNVDIVLLTGDDAEVGISVCKRIGISSERVVKGAEIDDFTEEEFTKVLETVKIFAELTPDQKVKIVNGLKANGHTVGYLGDGINDVPALCACDVAVSVDTARETAKEVADVLLLEKDLNVLADAVTEGRRILTNVQKYVNITAGSNFGNVLSLVIASIFLAFQPMIAMHLLLLNILYDLLCFTISWDNVDEEELKKPKVWTGKGLARFALTFGAVSSLFDILTFLFLYFLCCPLVAGDNSELFVSLFQTGWFLESMWSQIIILNILRTKKLPFIQSKPSVPFLSVCLGGIVLFTAITFTPLGTLLGFTQMPALYFVYLIIAVALYIVVVLLVKKSYLRRNREDSLW